MLDWQVAVFCQNEAGRIASCLASIDRALEGRSALITVIVNGSTDGSASVAQSASAGLRTPVDVYEIPFGDKANAINIFLTDRHLRRAASLYACLDGYVVIDAASFASIESALQQRPEAIAASGIAGNGRSSVAATRRALATGGALHGQFYTLRPEFVERLVALGYRLPVGLYRGDGLLGSMIAHDLDAVGQAWSNARLIAVAGATFQLQALSIVRASHLRRQFRRKVRQMRGVLETAAIKDVIYAGGYGALPDYADRMIADYLDAHPVPPTRGLDRWFMRLALKQHRSAQCPDPASLTVRALSTARGQDGAEREGTRG